MASDQSTEAAIVEDSRPDEALMQGVSQGDETAWTTLATRYRLPLVRFCASYLKDWHESEDIAHEVLLRLYRKADSYDTACPFQPWIFRIARNLCLDHLRRRGTIEVEWTENSSIGMMIERICDTTTSPAGKAVRKDIRSHIADVVRAMPEDARTALTLRYAHGLSTEEVANALDITPVNARVRLFRAIQSLKEALLPLLDEYGKDAITSVFQPDKA
jgi:RNA polymerase sigma factor (sigma-70 family)